MFLRAPSYTTRVWQVCSYLQTQAQVRLRGSAAFKEPGRGHGLGHGLSLGLDAFLLLRQQQIPPFISLAGYISPIIYPFKQIQSLKTYGTPAHVLNTTLYVFTSGRSLSNTANLLTFFVQTYLLSSPYAFV